MKRWLKRSWKRLRSRLRPAPPAPADHLRTEGDLARDAGRWRDAANAYGAYLKREPADFGIWVQYGHVLKEAGARRDADRAYGRALALRSDDADLLLHYGRLKRIAGDFPGAARLFQRAADQGMTDDLAAELGADPVRRHLSPSRLAALEARALQALSARAEGLTVEAAHGLLHLGDNRVDVAGEEAEVVLALSAGDEALGEVVIEASSHFPDLHPAGRLVATYDGRDLTLSLGSGRDRLVAPGRIQALRWRPDRRRNVLKVDRIAYRPVRDIDAALAEVRAAAPAEIHIESELEDARRQLAAGGGAPAEAARLTAFLSADLSDQAIDYAGWLARWIEPTAWDREQIAAMVAALPWRPRFSFVVPVYDTPAELLRQCLDSMLGQSYPDLEVCLADDCSPASHVWPLLQAYAARDPRVKIVRRETNGHISAASNSALALATGDFVVLVDHDDVVPDYCLAVVAETLNRRPEAQVLFSDEDKITPDGERFSPYFKAAFDPFLLYGHNMVSHLGVYRRDLLEAIGGFREGLEGSQDYDLLLRAYERCGADAVVHIPQVLYHWRAIPGSTAVSADQKSYAIVAAGRAINEHFQRTGLPLRSVDGFTAGLTGVAVAPTPEMLAQRVSIIIPTRNGRPDLAACIDSIRRTRPKQVEILIVDNQSDDRGALDYLAALERSGVARVIRHDAPFNFSAINNAAARQAGGDILCFLNNDTEVVSADWLDRARTLLSIDGVGAVGARLVYPDGTLQHFGLTLGMGGHRVAGTPHRGIGDDSAGYFGKARLMQQFSAVTAACLFVRRDLFERIGGFDEDFPVAYNDVDLCLRIRQAGFRIVGDPDITLVHKESRTRGADVDEARAARLEADARRMRDRWGAVLDSDPFWSPNHSLARDDFHLAAPPRERAPWRRAAPKLDNGPTKPQTRTRARKPAAGTP